MAVTGLLTADICTVDGAVFKHNNNNTASSLSVNADSRSLSAWCGLGTCSFRQHSAVALKQHECWKVHFHISQRSVVLF